VLFVLKFLVVGTTFSFECEITHLAWYHIKDYILKARCNGWTLSRIAKHHARKTSYQRDQHWIELTSRSIRKDSLRYHWEHLVAIRHA